MFVALYTMMWKYKVTKFKLLDVHKTFNHAPTSSPFLPLIVCGLVHLAAKGLINRRITNYPGGGVGYKLISLT